MQLSVVVPAYQEGDRILENLLEIADTLASFSPSWEIVLVDDGSRDATRAEAVKAQARIPGLRVLSYPRNRGKGFALRHGARHARGDLVAFLDADLELHPQQLPVLIEILSRQGADLVVGSKRHPRSTSHASSQGFPLSRRILSALYFSLVKLMFRLPVRDTQAGLKLFRRHVLSDVLPAVRTTRFAFDLDLLVHAHRAGYRVAEAPVAARFLRATSRLQLRDMWRIWADTLALYCRVHTAWRPLRMKRPVSVER
jgi:glycosyltransferase involved in cell wall biosynthesis